MNPLNLVLFKCNFLIESRKPIIYRDFTGKLVKTMLIIGNPSLEKLFAPTRGRPAKRIHVTPLYRFVNGKIKSIYPKSFNSVKHVKPIVLDPNSEYFFYIGASMDYLPLIEQSLLTLSSGVDIPVRNNLGKPLSIRLTSFDRIDSFEQILKLNTHENFAIKIRFMSPTLIKDPFNLIKYRRFLFSPGMLFSVNIGDLLDYNIRRYRRWVYRLDRIMHETHCALENIRRVWYLYEGRFLPAIVGYTKYYVVLEDFPIELRELIGSFLRNLFIHAAVLGVGTGRASGFGHVKIEAAGFENFP